ncbi:tripartite ATP-independent transporter DctM subunit [Neobacillus niacini]|uniref:TRAP transporter large permease n=1 Tax=Neobacillus niacini TaxID=86668 RepID=UPI00285D66E5|nr:TRAP transporter large permease subunit [Neobacillus niacini]MDR7075746.1 tripartite ATP-independent transporter DctM subunit [Neobacillus niacini]
MEPYVIALIMFTALMTGIMLGIPIAFVMSGISLIAGFIIWGGPASVSGFILSAFNDVNQFIYTAVPLYIFMAGILRYSDLIDGMYEAFYRWFGGMRGGLAVGTTAIATLFSAMVGTAMVSTATLGVTARPSMLSRGYNDRLTQGIILAGSGLGILIPPSLVMIIYAVIAEVSPGQLFMAGIIPGLMMAVIIALYALVLCWIRPNYGPALPKEERFTWKEKFVALKGVILPLSVITVVLASIFLGVATPTEAAAVGVIGSLVSAGINRKLTWGNIKKMFSMTIGLCAMVFWMVIGATAYAKIISVTRVGEQLAGLIENMNLSPTMFLIAVLIFFFILGIPLDAVPILFMTAPIILPILNSMGVDMVWFGVIFVISAITANLSPPFGMQLFVLKGVAPDINLRDTFAACWPMVGLFTIGTVILFIFPEIVTWLPEQMFNNR